MTDPEPAPEPLPPHRQHIPASPAEMRRKLLFGLTLVLALGSVYAGLLFQMRALQFAMAGLAVVLAILALISGGPPSAPPPPSGPESGPR